MSLIVTANIDDEINITSNSNAFKPFSYSNRLLNTLKIPANSQIALQSSKINKTGELVVSKSNSIFGHYFGRPLTDDGDNADSTTSVPFVGYAGDEGELESGAKVETNVVGFSNMIERGFSQRAYHPSLITATSASITVDPSYDTNTWDGFDWVFTQQTAKTTKTQDFNFTDVSETQESLFALSDTDTTVTGTNDARGFVVRADNFPVSQNEGEVVIDFSAGNTSGGTSPWFCGLTRINTSKEGVTAPEAFNPRRTTGKNPVGGAAQTMADVFQNKAGIFYTDICVM